MTFESHFLVSLTGVEVVNLHVFAVLDSEELPTKREFNLVTPLNIDPVELLQLFLQNVEHPHAV